MMATVYLLYRRKLFAVYLTCISQHSKVAKIKMIAKCNKNTCIITVKFVNHYFKNLNQSTCIIITYSNYIVFRHFEAFTNATSDKLLAFVLI